MGRSERNCSRSLCRHHFAGIFLSISYISNNPERVSRLRCLLSVSQVSLSRPKLLSTIKIYFPGVGFGRKISWRDDQAIPIGHRMTFKEALHIVSTDMILRLIVPEWAMGLTTRLRNVRVAFEELEVCTIFLLFTNPGPGGLYVS
jgi:hypothetical protein